MKTQKMVVNNQFNSPINLYSHENVQDTLHKQMNILTNGAVGIDFHTLAKPTNLVNSAVLRMLQEENSHKQKGCFYQYIANGTFNEHDLKRLRRKPKSHIKWPPRAVTLQMAISSYHLASIDAITSRKGLKQVTWPPPPIEDYYYQPQATQVEQPANYQGLQNSVQTNLPTQKTTSSPPTVQYKKPTPEHFEEPPSTILLRQTLPVRQAPAPVFSSQPATASIQGGARMRGDMKWPPEPYKQQAAAENAAREAIAKGPACRPRKVKRDYSSFFAQHALNSSYPSYRAPPGTQHQHADESNF